MTTNGYNLSNSIFKELCDMNVLDYQVTMDGLEAQHDRKNANQELKNKTIKDKRRNK